MKNWKGAAEESSFQGYLYEKGNIRILTCKKVSGWHHDKLFDQIADAYVTDCLQHDISSHVAIEYLLKDDKLIIAGEVTSIH